MKIPKSFQLMGQPYNVMIVERWDWPEELSDAVGAFLPRVNKIRILRNSRELMEHTYIHELLHAVFGALGEDKLSNNEKLVDAAAGLIHQALTTAK